MKIRIILLIFLTILPRLWSCKANTPVSGQKYDIGSASDTLMGDWMGSQIADDGRKITLIAQVIANNQGNYTIQMKQEFNSGTPAIALMKGTRIENSIQASGISSDGSDWRGEIRGRQFTGAVTGLQNYKLDLKKVQRVSPTLGLKPPDSAQILFDGTSLDQWRCAPDAVGYTDLAKQVGGNEAVAYLHSMVWSEADQKTILLIGSDDGIKVWINDKIIHQKNAQRGASPAQDTAHAELVKGWNKLLMKITNGDGGWGAFARFTDMQGKPLAGIAERDWNQLDVVSTRAGLEKYDGYLTSWRIAGPFRREGMTGQQLFDAVFEPEQSLDLAVWKMSQMAEKAAPAGWRLIGDVMEVKPGSGNIFSAVSYKNARLHVEFRSPFIPEVAGQKRGNSGVYLQGRYEIQVLDSYGLEGLDNECGGIYKVARPKVNMCAPPGQWQTYDIEFYAARFDPAGNKTANTRITVMHNGVAIHENLEIPGPTGGALDADESRPGPLMLQDHGDAVQYRNIWLEEIKH
jgi:hypothetical protein